MKDSNGKTVSKDVRREGDYWGANVWQGAANVCTVRRYYYATRNQARMADISDVIGKRGKVSNTGKGYQNER